MIRSVAKGVDIECLEDIRTNPYIRWPSTVASCLPAALIYLHHAHSAMKQTI
jgi:hypothetical protein